LDSFSNAAYAVVPALTAPDTVPLISKKMSTISKAITSEAESLIELLVAQCADLEALLVLARKEAVASANADFEELLAVTRDRATLGERLESYHRQISELRTRMGPAAQHVIESTVVKDSIRIVLEVQAQDKHTTSLLTMARKDTLEAITRLDQAHRNSAAYLSDTRTAGLNCDQLV
jgi:hypothetical protein